MSIARRALAATFFLSILAGCEAFTHKSVAHPVEFPMESPYGEVRTIAIAPAINLSGSHDFDPLVVSDILFAELQQVRGLNVLPLNKTLMAMQYLGVRSIDDPKIAQKLAEMLGANGLVVPAVTAYDPYNPPIVGMVLQMYTPAPVPVSPDARAPMIREMNTLAALESVQSNVPSTTASVSATMPNAPIKPAAELLPADVQRQPVSQVNAVFNSTNQSVLRELQGYAAGRTEYDSALQDQKFLMDSESYMRFVCHSMVRRLMDVESTRGADR